MTLMKRSVINPVLVITGGLTVLSGLFLMFHFESHFAKGIHQICGLFLLIFGIMHIIINWKALAVSLRGRLAAWPVAVVFAVCIIIMTVTGKFVPHHDNQADLPVFETKTADEQVASLNYFLSSEKLPPGY